MITSVVVEENTQIALLASRATAAWLARVSPAVTFRFEAVGAEAPHG